MPLFAVRYTYSPDTAAGRDDVRAAHRAWLRGLLEQGTVLSSGAFPDGTGALIIVSADDLDTTKTLFEQDPFAEADLLADVMINEWLPVMGTFTD